SCSALSRALFPCLVPLQRSSQFLISGFARCRVRRGAIVRSGMRRLLGAGSIIQSFLVILGTSTSGQNIAARQLYSICSRRNLESVAGEFTRTCPYLLLSWSIGAT